MARMIPLSTFQAVKAEPAAREHFSCYNQFITLLNDLRFHCDHGIIVRTCDRPWYHGTYL